jgi:hypothetical protein
MGFAFMTSKANRYRSTDQALAAPDPPLKHHRPHGREQYAAFHLPGIGADLRLLQSWGALKVSGRLQPSFGGLGAPAFYDWAGANLQQRGKHVVHRQGYFYGWGGAASTKAAHTLGPLRAGFELIFARYASQQGLDRHIERITVDVPISGDVLLYEGSLGVAPPELPVAFSLDVGVRRFRSKVEGFERTARAVERGLSATWTF